LKSRRLDVGIRKKLSKEKKLILKRFRGKGKHRYKN
jgi:hypothetical protein